MIEEIGMRNLIKIAVNTGRKRGKINAADFLAGDAVRKHLSDIYDDLKSKLSACMRMFHLLIL